MRYPWYRVLVYLEKEAEKPMKKKLDDYQILLIICVFTSILWTYLGSGLCATVLDQFIYVLFPFFLMIAVFFVKRFKLIGK